MKRYDYVPGLDGGMTPRENGKYVKHKHVANIQRQLAAREDEIAALVHPHDLAKYRKSK